MLLLLVGCQVTSATPADDIADAELIARLVNRVIALEGRLAERDAYQDEVNAVGRVRLQVYRDALDIVARTIPGRARLPSSFCSDPGVAGSAGRCAVSFCAQCIDGTEGLVLEEHNGRTVRICARCRSEHPRQGRYAFDGTSRVSRHHDAAGNHRVKPGRSRPGGQY